MTYILSHRGQGIKAEVSGSLWIGQFDSCLVLWHNQKICRSPLSGSAVSWTSGPWPLPILPLIATPPVPSRPNRHLFYLPTSSDEVCRRYYKGTCPFTAHYCHRRHVCQRCLNAGHVLKDCLKLPSHTVLGQLK